MSPGDQRTARQRRGEGLEDLGELGHRREVASLESQRTAQSAVAKHAAKRRSAKVGRVMRASARVAQQGMETQGGVQPAYTTDATRSRRTEARRGGVRGNALQYAHQRAALPSVYTDNTAGGRSSLVTTANGTPVQFGRLRTLGRASGSRTMPRNSRTCKHIALKMPRKRPKQNHELVRAHRSSDANFGLAPDDAFEAPNPHS